MTVSIANLYRLLIWAWDLIPPSGLTGTGAEAAKTPQDMLALVFTREVDRLLKRGLERRYVEHTDDLRIPRGRPLVEDTVSRLLMPQGRLACAFDELSEHTLANGLLLGTLETLSRAHGLSADASTAVRRTLRRFPQVEAVTPRAPLFSQVLMHRNNRSYRMPLHVAGLISASLIPDERGEHRTFDNFTLNERRMGDLFEAFVRNFWRREQRRWTVSAPQLAFVRSGSDRDLAFVPRMRTDITLSGRDRADGSWVVECKCTRHPYAGFHGARRLRSEHLYQLLAYLQTRRASGNQASGLLLYAQAGEAMRHDLTLNGEVLRVRSVDLSTDWPTVRTSLLGLVEECRARA